MTMLSKSQDALFPRDLINNISTSFRFYGTVPTINSLPKKANVGDIYVTTDTDKIYTWVDNEFIPLSGVDSEKETISVGDVKEIKELTCKHCGAPLIKSKYSNDAHCEYCDSNYMLV